MHSAAKPIVCRFQSLYSLKGKGCKRSLLNILQMVYWLTLTRCATALLLESRLSYTRFKMLSSWSGLRTALCRLASSLVPWKEPLSQNWLCRYHLNSFSTYVKSSITDEITFVNGVLPQMCNFVGRQATYCSLPATEPINPSIPPPPSLSYLFPVLVLNALLAPIYSSTINGYYTVLYQPWKLVLWILNHPVYYHISFKFAMQYSSF